MTVRRRPTGRIDLRDPDVDLRDAVISPSEQPHLDGAILDLVVEVADALDDPQVDLLLARVHKVRGH